MHRHAVWSIMFIIFSLVAALLSPSAAHAQGVHADIRPPSPQPRDNDTRFGRLSLQDGLSQSSVNCILQDHKGLLWLGTDDGLNKYDGYTLTVLRYDPDNPAGLANDSIHALHQSDPAALWIGTDEGLYRMDTATGELTRYIHDPADPGSLSGNAIRAIAGVEGGILWIGTDQSGLTRLDPKTGDMYRYTQSDGCGLSSDHITCLFYARNGILWIGTRNGGLNKLNNARGTFESYRANPSDPQALLSDHVTSIAEDRDGNLWVATLGGMHRFDRATNAVTRYTANPNVPGTIGRNEITCVFEDQSRILWAGTRGGGLQRWDPVAERWVHYTYDPKDPNSLAHNDVLTLYQDRGGVLWIGTHNGASKCNLKNIKFDLYRNDPADENSLASNRVTAIMQDRAGNVWIGTADAGLDCMAPSIGRWTHYRHDPGDPSTISSDGVHALAQDRTDAVWVATEAGLDRLDPATGRFSHYRYDNSVSGSLPDPVPLSLCATTGGDLWVGMRSGWLALWDEDTRRFAAYRYVPAGPPAPGRSDVLCVMEADDGRLWIGTAGGSAARFDPETGTFESFQHNPDDPNTLADDHVLAIHQDRRGRIYFGTLGGGLDRYDPATRSFTHYRGKHGLPNDVVYGILEDGDGYLWLSTNRGLVRFHPITQRFRNYDVTDGLQDNQFNAGACFAASSGQLFFGGNHGANAFYPQNVLDNPRMPPIVVTAVKRLNDTVMCDAAEPCEVRLSHSDNLISFEFAALDFTAPEKNQYSYMLEGLDPTWVDAGSRRYASYTNLRGGAYTFRVRGSNNDGTWNREGLALRIIVTPPVWDTWWFRSGAVALLVLGLVSGYRLRLQSVRQRTNDLERQVRERTHEIERRRQLAEGVRQILVILNSDRPLADTLDYIANRAAELTDARRVVIFQWNAGLQEPLIVAASALPGETWTPEGLLPLLPEVITRAIRSTEHLVVWDRDALCEQEITVNGSVLPYCFVLGAPIIVNEELYGGMVLYYEEEVAYSDEDLEQATSFADHAALAVANAELRKRMQEIAASAERSRLARDLHDAVTQTLFSASLTAEVLPSLWETDRQEGRQLLDELRQLCRGALAEMRTLLLELRPAALQEAHLPDLLRQLAEAATGRTGAPIKLHVEGTATLSSDVRIGLYRIAQEALNNVVKHARATHADLTLTCHSVGGATEVMLSIVDDGCGFDAASVPSDHLGLRIIRERAEAIGAFLTIDSRPGEGTRITVHWKGQDS